MIRHTPVRTPRSAYQGLLIWQRANPRTPCHGAYRHTHTHHTRALGQTVGILVLWVVVQRTGDVFLGEQF